MQNTIEVKKKEIDKSAYQIEEINVSTIPDVLSYCDPQGINLIIDLSEFALSRCPTDDESQHENFSEDEWLVL